MPTQENLFPLNSNGLEWTNAISKINFTFAALTYFLCKNVSPKNNLTMFNKETHNHTYMSDKAAKRLAKSNEKIAKEKLAAQEKAAREERWQREMEQYNQERIARESSPAYQERKAKEAEREAVERSNVIYRARNLAESGKADAFIGIMQCYQQYSKGYEFKDGTKRENDDTAKAILPLLQSFVVPAEKESIDLFFLTLDRQKEYIESFQKDERCKVFFSHIYDELVAKGNKAYDIWFSEKGYQITEEDRQAEQKFEELKKENRIDSIIDILKVYSDISVTHSHGSKEGREMNPVGQKIIDYLFAFQAPTEQSQLENFLIFLSKEKSQLKEFGKKHPTLNSEASFLNDNPYEILMKAADRVVKEQYKDVTDGMIGARNSQRKKNKTRWIIAIVVIVLFILLLVLTLA